MPELPVFSGPNPWAADLKQFRPYVYRGQGYDIFEDGRDPFLSEVPASCSCTWSWGAPGFRWVRIGVKEDCPWHRVGDEWAAGVRQP